jgi:KDO2-lipid IV(A) lauroyltransferase
MTNHSARKALRHRLEFGLFRCVRTVLTSLPRETVCELGSWLGLAFFHLDGRHRRVALQNLEACDLGLDPKARAEVARTSFRHFGRMFFESLLLMYAEPEEVAAAIRVEGLEHLDAVRAEGRGFIQLTGHYGNWEAIALGQSLHGRPIAAIGRRLENPLLSDELERLRSRFGNLTISKSGAIRETVRVLRSGWGVGFLMDQDAITMEVFVRFLGRWASTYQTAGALAVKFDLPILPVFAWPTPDGKTTVRFLPPIRVARTGDADRDAWLTTQWMSDLIDAQIRKDPRWWFWMHQRFKTQPFVSSAVAPPPEDWLRLWAGPTPPAGP